MRVTRRTMRQRFVILLFCLLAAIGGLLSRLAYLQTVKAPWLSQLADKAHNRSIPVEGTRGTIYDDQGREVAYTASAPSVILVPAQIKDKAGTAKALAQILQMDQSKVLQSVTKRASVDYLKPGGRRITDQQVSQIRALNLPGVYITEEGKRAYPYGNLAAQVLGITGNDNQGITGLEKQYDDALSGDEGAITFYAIGNGQRMPGAGEYYIPPTNGEDVKLTLDAQIQQFVEREVEQAVAEYNPDHVTAIVEQPSTGNILAMANYPTFNPADWKQYPSSTYDRNLAIWQTFEPGSTFKIVTLSAALQEQKVNLNDRFYDPGYYEVAGRKVKCWKSGGHGSQSYLNVVENSCNPGFIALGERLGKETLFSYIKKFGFGSKTGIDLPGEGNGILFKLSRVGPLELATTAFGQGVSVTPIQQVMAVGAVANGGLLMKPHLVSEFINHDTGQILDKVQPTVVRRVVSEQTAAQVRNALESVVSQGSGRNAFYDGYRIAGKTGTAQVAVNGHYDRSHYIVSFIGMAPADNPQLVAYIAIDYPRPTNGKPVFGGTIAAPIVGRILVDSLSYLGVQPSDKGIPFKPRYGIDIPKASVPDFVGMTISDASRTAIQSSAQLQLQVVGSGKYVIAQSPPGGTMVDLNSTVRLFLGAQPPETKSPNMPTPTSPSTGTG